MGEENKNKSKVLNSNNDKKTFYQDQNKEITNKSF